MRLCENHCTPIIKSEFRCILRGSNQKTKLKRDELVCMSWDLSFVILMLTDGGWQVCLGAVDSKREKWSATVCRGCSSRTNAFSFFLFFNITFSFQFKTYQVKTKKQGTLLHNSRQRETTQSKSSVFTFWCFEEIIWCCFFFKFLFDGIVSVHHHSSGAELRSQWKPVEWYCYCFFN